MVSEASWQTGVGRHQGGSSAEVPMDQQSVESLLRRLVERVEESERRYSEALSCRKPPAPRGPARRKTPRPSAGCTTK